MATTLIGLRRRVACAAVAVGLLTGGMHAQDNSRLSTYRRVDDDALQKPSNDDWLHWRRTLDNWGYSPLTQINPTNASQLKTAWSLPLEKGINQPGPLVHDGVMFVPLPPGRVIALDGATGRKLWEYRKTFEAHADYSWGARTRTMALYDDKVFIGTPDAHLVALDVRTGAVVWDLAVADYKLGYRYTSGPIVAKGRIIAGMTGCERFKDGVCFISGHDARTGRELWRVSTIARPGEAGGDSWGDLPLNRRAGGDVWIPGAFDPATGLSFWSTANPKPWARVSRKTDGSALYTNSVLAIDPENGTLKWYHQFLAGDTLDHDEVFENVLIDHDGRQSLYKMGKLGILWEIDRRTGKFLSSHDLGFQNVVEVNPQDGTVKFVDAMIPRLNTPLTFCPGMGGVRNWQSSAYHPATGALYIPLRPNCEKAQFGDVKPENTGDFHFYGNPQYNGVTHLGTTPHPATPNDRGLLVAMDIRTGAIKWRQGRPVNASSALLTLGGGLVASGMGDGTFLLLDASTGTTVFETRTAGTSVQGFPVSYAVDGKQYLAYTTVGATSALHVLALP